MSDHKTASEATRKVGRELSVVGVGASAGGLAAFEAFFSGMPADRDPNMAFVLVQHLAPDHKSLLGEIIRRHTRMEVFDIEDGMVVQPNCTYVITPDHDLALIDGVLELLTPSSPHGQRRPIDFFFSSLAQALGEQAICIVLSGTGSDGSKGLIEIKNAGGMVIAQTPASADFDGMPQSAIDTGLVDYELEPAEMPDRLIAYVEQVRYRSTALISMPKTMAENALKKIFVLLRNGTGHDFSQYKLNTIYRRLDRRMVIHKIETINDYIGYLEQTPAEVDALFRDMLIGVTSFFRDPEAFDFLKEQIIPELFMGKPAGSKLRVWCPGCSSGEEAYSIAMLFREHVETLGDEYTVQIFATDIDSNAIATARAGTYPASIAAIISPDRLARFFAATEDGSAYRVKQGIRDMLVFSEQDLIKDPPFSKLDLLSCRNLLIYIDGDLQKRLIPLFHYALNPDGVLFLGTSETIGDHDKLFSTIDRKSKLFKRKENLDGAKSLPLGPYLLSTPGSDAAHPATNVKTPVRGKLPFSELTERTILENIAPVAVLVDVRGDIAYLHGRTGMYLELASGDVGTNITKMARDGLNPALTLALREAALSNEIVRKTNIRVKTNGDYTDVNLTVYPVTSSAEETSGTPLYLIAFEEAPNIDLDQLSSEVDTYNGKTSESPDASTERLKQELLVKEEYLQRAIADLDASNDKLKSSNEDMQSVNEELQSTNEELETSKEELQSVNEELATVNTELYEKVGDLSRANNDMKNLLAGTGIATVFVDLEQRILRFTPAATRIINLIEGDTGRPVGHIVSNLTNYSRLVDDVQKVMDTLIPLEADVLTVADQWYRMHIQPYRTLSNVIEGAVITFVDITEVKRSQAAVVYANTLSSLATIARDSRDCMLVQDMEGNIQVWNRSAEKLYGWSEAEALTMNIRDLIPKELGDEAFVSIQHLSEAESLEPYTTGRICKNGEVLTISLISTALVNEEGETFAIATTERAINVNLT